MKNKTNPIAVTFSSLALASVLIFWTPVQAQPGSTQPGSNRPTSTQPSSARPSTTPSSSVSGNKAGDYHAGAGNKEMMERQRKMQEKTKAEDTALNAQVAAMNRAPDDRKVALMADIITTMVKQRAAANDRMGMMMGQQDNLNRDATGQQARPTGRDATSKANTPYNQNQ